MTQAFKRPSTATRRTGGGQPTTDGPGPRGEHDLRGEQDLVGDRDRDDGNDRNDRTERDQRNSRDEQSEQRARREQDARREDRADDRDEQNERDDRDGRRGQDSRREQDLRGEQGRVGDRDERGPRDARGEQWDDDRGEFGGGRESRREPGGVQRALEQVTDRIRPVTTNPVDAFAVAPDMSKVVTAWFDMAFDMMKLQQQFFATVLGAGNTNERNTTKG
jgi:hypothetical protein